MVIEFINCFMDVFRVGIGKFVDEVWICIVILIWIVGVFVNICKICNKYMLRIVLCEKMLGSFENCLIFFFCIEVFEVFIKFKILYLNFIGDLLEIVWFWRMLVLYKLVMVWNKEV